MEFRFVEVLCCNLGNIILMRAISNVLAAGRFPTPEINQQQTHAETKKTKF